MSKLFHIIQKGLSYDQCMESIWLILNDISKEKLEIRIDRIFSKPELKFYVNLNISYFKRGGKG